MGFFLRRNVVVGYYSKGFVRNDGSFVVSFRCAVTFFDHSLEIVVTFQDVKGVIDLNMDLNVNFMRDYTRKSISIVSSRGKYSL
jgi:hypothetical protein